MPKKNIPYDPDTLLDAALNEILSSRSSDAKNKDSNNEAKTYASDIIGVLRKHFKTKLKISHEVDLSSHGLAIFSSEISCFEPRAKEFTVLSRGKFAVDLNFIKSNHLIGGVPPSIYASDTSLMESLKALGAISAHDARSSFVGMNVDNKHDDKATTPSSDNKPQLDATSALHEYKETNVTPINDGSKQKVLVETQPQPEVSTPEEADLTTHKRKDTQSNTAKSIDNSNVVVKGKPHYKDKGGLSEKAYNKIFEEINAIGTTEATVISSYQGAKRPKSLSYLSERQGYALLRKLKEKPSTYWKLIEGKATNTKTVTKQDINKTKKQGFKKTESIENPKASGKDRVFKPMDQRDISARVMQERRTIKRSLSHQLPQEKARAALDEFGAPNDLNEKEMLNYLDSLPEKKLIELSSILRAINN